MGKRTWEIGMGVLGLLAILLLDGCLGRGIDGKAQDVDGSKTQETVTDFHFLEELEAEEWQDNALDDLHAVLNLPVERVTAEGELEGGLTTLFVGEGGGMVFKTHLYDDFKNSWSGVSGVTAGGEAFSKKLELEPDRTGTQIHKIGPVSGKDGYVACFYQFKDGKPGEYWFYELDESFGRVSCVQGAVGDDELFESLMGDAEGNFHMTFQRTNGKCAYVVISPEGERIFETDLENRPQGHVPKLCAFGKGRIAVHDPIYETDKATGYGRLTGHKFYAADLEGGTLREMDVSTEDAVKKLTQEDFYYVTPVSDAELAWCNRSGIFVYDVKSRETRSAYKWSNHGIFPRHVYDMSVMADGSVGMLYDGTDGLRYLLLNPTEEKKELPSITIAVSTYNKAGYESAANHFKKSYPGYVVIVRDDWDETSLLTQLGAGEGPVLVDTELTGFEELEHLWQPLDGFLEQTGIADELIPKALEFGKIGDVTYGIVRDFCIDTLITMDSAPDDWDYDGFLDALEQCGGAPLTNDHFESPVDWREKYFEMLGNGTGDNYYFDVETGRMVFGTDQFGRVLKLSQKAAKCPPYEDGKALREGRALCEQTYLVIPAQVFRLRRRLESDGEKVAGYPTGNGAKHLLVAHAPLAMRSTATEEEKKIAYTFMKTYLSADAMNSAPELLFPVRKDVFEKQVRDYETDAKNSKEYGRYNPSFMPLLDRDKDVPFLYGLIENGVVRKSFPSGLQEVFDEELGDYLAGRIDGTALDNHLKSRVWLYLEETK